MNAKLKEKLEDFEEVEIGNDAAIYPTGVVCKIIGIPIWALKQLDIEGLVCPPREIKGSSRLYSKRELKKVERCWFFMNKHKVKVMGLRVILKMQDGTFDGP